MSTYNFHGNISGPSNFGDHGKIEVTYGAPPAEALQLAADLVQLVRREAARPELAAEAEFVRSLGFAAKSAIQPRQIPILHEVFAPSVPDLEWAREVLAAFEAAGRGATRLPNGEFVDLPVAQRAQRLLDIAAQIEGDTAVLKLADPGSPTLIQDKDAKGALYVLMPMRV